jgi:flagellar FliL protein
VAEDEAAAAAKPAAPAEPAAPAKSGGGKKKRLLLLAGGAVLLAGGGAGAWFGFFRGHRAAEAKVEAPEPVKLPEHGALVALDPFIVNLGDEDRARYLKATLQLEFYDTKVPEVFPSLVPQIRDLLITLFSSRTFAEVRTPDGKLQLREDAINRINRALNQDLVKAVYFTEFVVQ